MRYHPHRITTDPEHFEQCYLATDASSDGSPEGDPMVGGVIITPEGKTLAFSRTASELKGVRIEIIEAVAVLEALEAFSSQVGQRQVILMVDNSVLLYAMVRGDSRAEKVASIVAEINATREELGAKTWVEFIKSEFNPADGFTRDSLMGEFLQLIKPLLVSSRPPTIENERRNYVQDAVDLVEKAKS